MVYLGVITFDLGFYKKESLRNGKTKNPFHKILSCSMTYTHQRLK